MKYALACMFARTSLARRRSLVPLSLAVALLAPPLFAAEPVEDLGGDEPAKKPGSDDDKPKSKPVKPKERPEDRPKPTDVPTTDEILSKGAEPTAPGESASGHGSQAAFGAGLPILIGGLGGIVLGGIAGFELNPSDTPATTAALVGVGLGALGGCAAGSWVHRTLRDEDPRWSGAIVGLSIGAGLGTALYAHIVTGDHLDSVSSTPLLIGKIAGLALLPLLGTIAGYRIAATFAGPEKPPDSTVMPAPTASSARVVQSLAPSIAPVFGPRDDVRGVSVGMVGTF